MADYQPVLEAIGDVLIGVAVDDPLAPGDTLEQARYLAPTPDKGHVFERMTWEIDLSPDKEITEEHNVGTYTETFSVSATLYLGEDAHERSTLERNGRAILRAVKDALRSEQHYGLGGLVETMVVAPRVPEIDTLPNNGVEWVALSLDVDCTRTSAY